MQPIVSGALAGLAATAVMTAAMRVLWGRLPAPERYPLPPREIVDRILPNPVRRRAGEEARRELTMAAHFGYGAATGALLPLLTRSRRLDVGAAYGVGVWAASYLGWIPAAAILAPAAGHPARRNALMIGVHVLWGASTAAVLAELGRAARGPFAAGPDRDACPIAKPARLRRGRRQLGPNTR